MSAVAHFGHAMSVNGTFQSVKLAELKTTVADYLARHSGETDIPPASALNGEISVEFHDGRFALVKIGEFGFGFDRFGESGEIIGVFRLPEKRLFESRGLRFIIHASSEAGFEITKVEKDEPNPEQRY